MPSEEDAMCQVVAFVDNKGGVGKTVSSICTAELLAESGSKVLLVDMDQQRNATKRFGAEEGDGVVTVFDVLASDEVDLSEAIEHCGTVDLMRGDVAMRKAEAVMAGMTAVESRLADALDALREKYDFIVIDSPPSLTVVGLNVLVTADWVVVAMELAQSSVDGWWQVRDLLKTVRSNRRLNPGVKVAGFLVTLYDVRCGSHRAFAETLPQLAEREGTRVFSTPIRRCVKAKDADDRRKSLFEYAPKCTTAQDYARFVRELREVCSNG